jgi:hypothetical protein
VEVAEGERRGDWPGNGGGGGDACLDWRKEKGISPGGPGWATRSNGLAAKKK